MQNVFSLLFMLIWLVSSLIANIKGDIEKSNHCLLWAIVFALEYIIVNGAVG